MPARSRFLEGPFAPVTEEVTAVDLPVTGQVPAALNGRYLRNGPNPLGPLSFLLAGLHVHWLYAGFLAQVITMAGIALVSLRTPAPAGERQLALCWDSSLLTQYEGSKRPWYQGAKLWFGIYAAIWLYLYWRFW